MQVADECDCAIVLYEHKKLLWEAYLLGGLTRNFYCESERLNELIECDYVFFEDWSLRNDFKDVLDVEAKNVVQLFERRFAAEG